MATSTLESCTLCGTLREKPLTQAGSELLCPTCLREESGAKPCEDAPCCGCCGPHSGGYGDPYRDDEPDYGEDWD